MHFYRCRICGETYLGSAKPSDCPFCGADTRFMTLAEEYPDDINDVAPTESELTDIKVSIELERANTHFYLAMAARKDNLTLASGYERLASIEAKHCTVFSKLAGVPRPSDLVETGDELGSWDADIEESLRRETHASAVYAKFAARATTPRLIEVWNEIAAVETDHIELDEVAKRYL
jgi:rubrerythrin